MSERLQEWKDPKYLVTFIIGKETKKFKEYYESTINFGNIKNTNTVPFSNVDLIESCKELIFNVIDGKPRFHAISYAFDRDKAEIRVGHFLDILTGENSKEINEEVYSILAISTAVNIPVYPNTNKLKPLLKKYYKKMLTNGFLAPGVKGKMVRLMIKLSSSIDLNNIKFIENLSELEVLSPTVTSIIKDIVKKEVDKYRRVETILNNLNLAIHELEILLDYINRNENQIQKCLEKYPILFGPEYLRIIPKHELGAEYEMDFALERTNGLYDLVEIEASNHRLFTKKGDPRQCLIHAEQQVLDWIDWVEKHGEYGRYKLPGLISPVGYIVIGRNKNLTKEEKEKLRRRNLTFQGKLQILTYDDLIEKAKNLLKRLEDISF